MSIFDPITKQLDGVAASYGGAQGSQNDTAQVSANVSNLMKLAEGQTDYIVGLQTRSSLRFDNLNSTQDADLIGRFPYLFYVLQATKNPSGENKDTYSVVSAYRLPINPQDLQITTPFAIKTTVTNRGILEEHNGAPLKSISLSGTTGSRFNRAVSIGKQNNISNAITNGTLGIFQSTAEAISDFVDGNKSLFDINSDGSTSDKDGIKSTGYYQYHLLKMFLEAYAEIKKNPGGAQYRLAFAMPKDKTTYLVTPNVFVSKRSVASPMEYNYSISMTAWATVDIGNKQGADNTQLELTKTNPSLIKDALNAISEARKKIKKFSNIVSTARSDIEANVLGPINNVILTYKELVSAAYQVADFPQSVKETFAGSVISSWSRFQSQFALEDRNKISSIIQQQSGVATYVQLPNEPNTYESAPIFTYKTNAIVSFIEDINVNLLSLHTSQIVAMQNAIDRSKLVNANDINAVISLLNSIHDDAEKLIQDLDPQNEEWDLLYSLKEAIQQNQRLLASSDFYRSSSEDSNSLSDYYNATTSMGFWSRASDAGDNDFTIPKGKFSVQMTHGTSLEQLALNYLGNVNRWGEIAALNGLQYPYVDEEGFTRNLIIPGDNQIILLNDVTNLMINQVVYLMSNTQPSIKVRIKSIKKNNDQEYSLNLDTPIDLNIYKTLDNAKIRAYLPYTVNHLSDIYIPTEQTSSDYSLDEIVPVNFLENNPALIKFSKIDLALTAENDLAIGQDGFFNLSYGKGNLLQAARLKLQTPEGSLPLHPNYGLGAQIGENLNDIDFSNFINKIRNNFKQDPRFLDPSSIDLRVIDGAFKLDITAKLSNMQGILPINMPLFTDRK